MILGPHRRRGSSFASTSNQVEFKDKDDILIDFNHSAAANSSGNRIPAGDIVITSPGANGVLGPLAFWRVTTGAARRYVATAFAFRGAGVATVDTSVYLSRAVCALRYALIECLTCL